MARENDDKGHLDFNIHLQRGGDKTWKSNRVLALCPDPSKNRHQSCKDQCRTHCCRQRLLTVCDGREPQGVDAQGFCDSQRGLQLEYAS